MGYQDIFIVYKRLSIGLGTLSLLFWGVGGWGAFRGVVEYLGEVKDIYEKEYAADRAPLDH